MATGQGKMFAMDVVALPAFKDNYIWLLRQSGHAVVVDPGDAGPVLRALRDNGDTLAAVLLTHHHDDHAGGVIELISHYPVPVFGPALEAIAGVDHPLRDGDRVELPLIGASFAVLEVAGHTRGHIAYYGANRLFCGDTLFAGGCGRVFEGTPEQMWRSLMRIASLPPETQIYCAHEYTQANLRFAAAVEPDNVELRQRIAAVDRRRAAGEATVPSTLAEELLSNPFLRCRQAAVIAAAQRVSGGPCDSEAEVFAAVRAWKNGFR